MTVATSGPTASFQLRLCLLHGVLVSLHPCQSGGSEADAFGAGVGCIALPLHHAPGFALGDQRGHGLFGHAGACSQIGQARALQLEVPRDVDVCCTDLPARGQVGQTPVEPCG